MANYKSVENDPTTFISSCPIKLVTKKIFDDPSEKTTILSTIKNHNYIYIVIPYDDIEIIDVYELVDKKLRILLRDYTKPKSCCFFVLTNSL